MQLGTNLDLDVKKSYEVYPENFSHDLHLNSQSLLIASFHRIHVSHPYMKAVNRVPRVNRA